MPTYPDQSSSLLWTSSHPTGLSAVRCRLVTRVTLRQLPSSSSFVQLPDWCYLPTSGHVEISSPKPFVWFRAKTDKGIVCLADLLHSVTAGRPAFARPYVGINGSTSLMSSSLLLQQCSACLVRLTWIVFVMGGRWPYSWCLVGCCRQDLFNIASIQQYRHNRLEETVFNFIGQV